MDNCIKELAEKYRSKYCSNLNIKESISNLYKETIKRHRQTLIDAITSSIAIKGIFLSDQIDYSKITPQMEEAFNLAYPNVELNSLSGRNPEEIEGFLNAWKGKYFEVIVRDKLNDGDWIGNIHLEPGQSARLADSVTQSVWDLQILNPDGTIAEELQLKATDSLSYIKSALERYPDIKVVSTDEISDRPSDLSDIVSSGISNESLDETISQPMEELLDSSSEELIEDILPFLPFIVIATTEGTKVLLGKKTFGEAIKEGTLRTIKSGISMGVGTFVVFLDGGILSVPATFLTRFGIDIGIRRYKNYENIKRYVDAKKDLIKSLLPYYKAI